MIHIRNVVLSLLLVLTASAQNPENARASEISGIVKDGSGAVVPEAIIILGSTKGGQVSSTTSGLDGRLPVRHHALYIEPDEKQYGRFELHAAQHL